MTGERPQDDDVLEPTEDAPGADADAEAADADELELEADAQAADADAQAIDLEPEGELQPEDEFVDEVASGPEPVVSDKKAAAVAAAVAAERPHDDDLPYIDDRVSKIWVGLIAATFIGILLWGLLGGKAGFLSPQPTPEPTPSPVPSLTASPRPSTTPRPSPSASPATSASPAPSASPAAPSASPSAAPSVAPSPTLGQTALAMSRWLGRFRGQASGGSDQADVDWATFQLENRGIRDPQVLAAMRAVPRERFVPPDLRSSAYNDGALPIGHGQTISQPYIVASMTAALALGEWSAVHPGAAPRILDVGTGSGYQAAVLAAMGAEVVSIERDAELADRARGLLVELGYDVKVIVGDGSGGFAEEAPYAGIVVAAAAPSVPVPLVEQLLPDGRLVIPIGTRGEQSVTLVRPAEDGFTQEAIEPAVFVPLLGEHGFGDR
jgi:protein-L-isoaspartate(D-aspartate) O-methyltransferase